MQPVVWTKQKKISVKIALRDKRRKSEFQARNFTIVWRQGLCHVLGGCGLEGGGRKRCLETVCGSVAAEGVAHVSGGWAAGEHRGGLSV